MEPFVSSSRPACVLCLIRIFEGKIEEEGGGGSRREE